MLNDEVRAAIGRAVTIPLWGEPPRITLARQLKALADEPAVCERLKDVYVEADWENFDGMSAALKALANECGG